MSHTELVANVGYFLMLLAFLARDVLWLRLLLVFGQGSVVVYAVMVDALPVAYWNALFTLINAGQLMLVVRERRGVKIPADLLEFYDRTFAAFTPNEFLRVWRSGTVEEKHNLLLMQEGETPGRLLFLIAGEVLIEKRGQCLARLGRGCFLGEMSLLTGGRASADARAPGMISYIAWDTRQLREWRERQPALWIKFQSVLGKDLVDKIRNASASVSHGASGSDVVPSETT
ncbi:MAG: cyclic nucleotide-binding domain-containing protein [Nevskiales bacterium]